MSDDTYFRMPDDVAQGGLHAALEDGKKDVTFSTFQYLIADVLPNLGRADRIHFFVMLCGGAMKVESDKIGDVQFQVHDDGLIARVLVASECKTVKCNIVLGEQ